MPSLYGTGAANTSGAHPAARPRVREKEAWVRGLPARRRLPILGVTRIGTMNTDVTWEQVLASLAAHSEVSRAMFATCLAQSHLVAHEDGRFVIGVPSGFARDKLEQRFRPLVEGALQSVVGQMPGEVQFVVAERNAETPDPTTAPAPARRNGTPAPAAAPRKQPARTSAKRRSKKAKQPPAGSVPLPRLAESNDDSPYAGLHPRYTFREFIVGKHSQLAHAAARAVADTPAGAYNPLFLYGGVGLGKTHLLHAIGHHVLRRHTGTQVLYVTSETFTNDFINHIRRGHADAFRSKYRTTDILLIDDIQFLSGKEQTQEEFFHTFNTLHGETRQIVLTSDRPPAAIAALEDRLRSRFAMGLIADIQPPDFETRVAILRTKAAALAAQVSPEVLDFIAQRVTSNIRELEGALTRVVATSGLQAGPLTPDQAAAALNGVVSPPAPKTISPERIIQAIIGFSGITDEALRGKGRAKQVVLPRQVAMYLLREDAGASLVEIGRLLGGRDHSTVLHGVGKIGRELERNATVREQVQAVRAMVAG